MLTDQKKAFARVLDLVEDAGCIKHVILVGHGLNTSIEKPGYCQNSLQI